jgi:NADH dehydrogenase/NADH:ubiquinone oxidoreductase subunit G
MSDEIVLTIDGREVRVPPGTTLMQAARHIGVEIPTICYHDHTTSNGLCRQCVVEVEKMRVLAPSCMTQASPGMVVHTNSQRVQRARRTLLEMLNASVDLSEAPELQEQMRECDADPKRFPDAERRAPVLKDDNPMYVRDYAKCILCWRCVQVCAADAQFTFAINFDGRGYHSQIGTFFDRPIPETTCVFCGQCVGVCPTGALKGKREFLMEQGLDPQAVFTQTRRGHRRSLPVGVPEEG